MKGFRLLFPLLFGGLLVVGLLFMVEIGAEAGPALQAPDVWAEAAPAPRDIGFYGSTQCPGDQDSFYVLDSKPSVDPTESAFWRYDAAANSWITLTNYPITKAASALACYEGYIYAAGGGLLAGVGITNAFYIYDIAANTWMRGPTLPRQTMLASLGAWNGYLYLIGGANANVDPVSQVDRYDIQAATWQAGYGRPIPISMVGSSVQAGPHVYLVGGITQFLSTNSNGTLRYDMAHDSWESGPLFQSRRAFVGLAITEKYLYAMGGDANGGSSWWNVVTDVQRLDWTTWPAGVWETAEALPYAVEGSDSGACTEAMAGGEVWSAGGATGFQVFTETNLYLAAEPCFTGSYSMTLDPGAAGGGVPGREVVYHLTLTNTGTAYDSYTVTVGSVAWATVVSNPGQVDPFASASIVVTVTIPMEAPIGSSDVATVTLTSQGDPMLTTESVLMTTAEARAYLPVFFKP